MAIKSEKDYAIIDAVISDYGKKGSTDQMCPYCNSKMVLMQNDSSYEVKCPNGCISEAFRGI